MTEHSTTMPPHYPHKAACLSFHPRDLAQLINAGAALSVDGRHVEIDPRLLPADNIYACRTGYSPQCKIPLILHSQEGFEYLGFSKPFAEKLMDCWARLNHEKLAPSPKGCPPFVSCAITAMTNRYLAEWDSVVERASEGELPPLSSSLSSLEPPTHPPAQPSTPPLPQAQVPAEQSFPGEAFFCSQQDFDNLNLYEPVFDTGNDSGAPPSQQNNSQPAETCGDYADFDFSLTPCVSQVYSQQPTFMTPQAHTPLHQHFTRPQPSDSTPWRARTLPCRSPEEFVSVVGQLTGLRPEAAWNAYYMLTDVILQNAGIVNTEDQVLTPTRVVDIIVSQRYQLLLQVKAMSEWRAEHWTPRDAALDTLLRSIPRCVIPAGRRNGVCPLQTVVDGIQDAVRMLKETEPNRGQVLRGQMESNNNFRNIPNSWIPAPVRAKIQHTQNIAAQDATAQNGTGQNGTADPKEHDFLRDKDWEGIKWGYIWDGAYH